MSSRTHLLEPTSSAAWAMSTMDNSLPPSHLSVLPPTLLTYSEPSLDPNTQDYIKAMIKIREANDAAATSVASLASAGSATLAPPPTTVTAGAEAPAETTTSSPSAKKGCHWAPTPTPSQAGLTDLGSSVGGSANGAAAGGGREHKESITAKDYHKQKQGEHRKTRRRHFTDPVDFEGILHIIGGCGWWQIWIYLLISLQQIPHSMFNLSVVYMMFQPDHWCKVPGLNEVLSPTPGHKTVGEGWNLSSLLNTHNFAFKTEHNQQRNREWHSQCKYIKRPYDEYHSYVHQPFANVTEMFNKSAPAKEVGCKEWEYDRSVMTDTIVTQWNLVCSKNLHRADAQLAYSLGFLVGCFISGLSSDRFGRKPTVIGFGVLASMFGIILPYSTYFPMFLLIRFLSAVCNEAADLAAYVLCMEITGTKYRAMVGSFLQAPWAIGYALLAAVAYLTKSWRIMQIITAALHTVTILLICVLPESPRWLIVNNRVREAERIIRKACRMNKSQLPADMELVKHAENRMMVKRHKRAHLGHLLQSRVLLMRTGIIFVIWVATALVYYGLVIALSDQSGPGRSLFSGNFFVNNAVAGAIELPTLLGCVFLLRFGRKKSQMSTLIMSGLMIIAGMVTPQTMSGIRLMFMMLAKVFIQAAFNILYIFTSELYPTVIRNSAVGASSMVARLGAGVASYVAILSDVTFPIVPLIIFGVFSLVSAAMVLFLPETCDQPLPDTLQDAVTFLNDSRACAGGMGIPGRLPARPLPSAMKGRRQSAGNAPADPSTASTSLESQKTAGQRAPLISQTSDPGVGAGGVGGVGRKTASRLPEFSRCLEDGEEEEEGGVMDDVKDALRSAPAHPNQLPETTSDSTLGGSVKVA